MDGPNEMTENTKFDIIPQLYTSCRLKGVDSSYLVDSQ